MKSTDERFYTLCMLILPSTRWFVSSIIKTILMNVFSTACLAKRITDF